MFAKFGINCYKENGQHVYENSGLGHLFGSYLIDITRLSVIYMLAEHLF